MDTDACGTQMNTDFMYNGIYNIAVSIQQV